MRRKLTKEEEDMTKKGKTINQEQLLSLKKSLEYNRDVVELNKVKRAHELKWGVYLAEEKEKEEIKILKMMEVEIKQLEEKIKIANEHLNAGVEIKENKITG